MNNILMFQFVFVNFMQPTIPAEGKPLPRIGSIGHLTRIANKLVQLGNNSSVIQEHLQVCYYISGNYCIRIFGCLTCMAILFDIY